MAEAGSLKLRTDEIDAILGALKPEIDRTARIVSEFHEDVR
jgi:hypothetical protein